MRFKNYYKKIFPVIFGLFLLLGAMTVHAQVSNQGGLPDANAGGTTTGADPNAAGNHLFNPIKYTNLGDLIVSVTRNFVLLIAVVSVGFIVLGGAELVISAGNPESIEKGKKTITWAVIGLIVALLAFSIVAIIQDLIGVK